MNIKGTCMEVMRSGVLAAVIMKIMIFWDGMSYTVVGRYRQFGRICLPDIRATYIFLIF
jgi:hypothetical protein